MFLTAIAMIGALTFQDTPPPAPLAPSTSAGQENADASPPSTTAAQRPRRVCERRAPTGRRLEQRVCYTEEEMAAMISAKRREAEEMVARTNIQNDRTVLGGNGGPN